MKSAVGFTTFKDFNQITKCACGTFPSTLSVDVILSRANCNFATGSTLRYFMLQKNSFPFLFVSLKKIIIYNREREREKVHNTHL